MLFKFFTQYPCTPSGPDAFQVAIFLVRAIFCRNAHIQQLIILENATVFIDMQ